MADTSNFSWTKPTPDGDTGVWDTILNTLFDDADADLNTVKGTADAALPKSGGVMSGEVEIKTERYEANILGGSVSGPTTIDLSVANFHIAIIGGDTTFSFTNWPASGKVEHVELELTNAGGHTISWPAAVKWDGGSAPTLQSAGADVLVFYSHDGGTTLRGMHSYSRSA